MNRLDTLEDIKRLSGIDKLHKIENIIKAHNTQRIDNIRKSNIDMDDFMLSEKLQKHIGMSQSY